MDDLKYLIWSNEHNAWWRSKEAGYTYQIEFAGVYSREETINICATARDGIRKDRTPTEIPVLLNDIEELYQKEKIT